MKQLGPQHHRFIANYVARPHNAAAAYIAAGFSPGGARQSVHKLLRDPMIQAEIKRLIEEKHKALHMDVDEILARAAMLARIDVAALYDENGALRPIHELDESASIAISGIEVQEITSGTGKNAKVIGSLKKVRLRDPMAAIRLLAEHKKLVRNTDDGVNALASAIAERLNKARMRRKAKEK
jgi:phage terminase small subunit